MTNDTPLWYMDGTLLKHRNAPIGAPFASYILDRVHIRINDGPVVDHVVKEQPNVSCNTLHALYEYANNSRDCVEILRTILIEQSQTAAASTANLEAQLAQALDDLQTERETVRAVDKWRREIGDSFLDLTLQYNQQTIELKQVTDALNERTLELNNLRQFYRNRDAELDRMREYVRHVTQEKEGLRAQLRIAGEQLDKWAEIDAAKTKHLEDVVRKHNELCDERDEMEQFYLRTRDRRDHWKTKYDALRDAVKRAAECMHNLDAA